MYIEGLLLKRKGPQWIASGTVSVVTVTVNTRTVNNITGTHYIA